MIAQPPWNGLRNPELMQFIRQTLKICRPAEGLQGMAEILNTLQQTLAGLSGLYPVAAGWEQTAELEALDLRRDAALAGIRGMVAGLTRHYVPEKALAARQVLALFDHFGTKLTVLNYIAETEVIYAIVRRLTTDDALRAATVLLHCDDWVNELGAANTAFNGVFMQRTAGKAGKRKGGLAPGRKMAIAAYRKMAAQISALQVVQPDALLVPVIAGQNVLVKDYRELVKRRTGGGSGDEDAGKEAG